MGRTWPLATLPTQGHNQGLAYHTRFTFHLSGKPLKFFFKIKGIFCSIRDGLVTQTYISVETY